MWLGFIVSVLYLQINWSHAVCPPSEVVSPCRCKKYREPFGSGDGIWCGGRTITNLSDILQRIANNQKANERHFYRLEIFNTSIEEIGKDLIGNLTFDYVSIVRNNELRKINQQAFSNSASRIKYVWIFDSPKYSLAPSPNNIFDMLNSFVNVQAIWIDGVNITHLPSEAFKSLRSLTGMIISNSTLSVADRAFYNLDNLTTLYLLKHRSNHFPTNAFEFRSQSNQTLNLNLFWNKLNSSSFASGWLNKINRQVVLDLNTNEITFLDKSVFQPFLDDSRSNKIFDLELNPLNCSDCRNAWLRKGQDKYKGKVNNAFCDRNYKGKTIFDSNFDHCF